jgi:hypothetical protein
MIDSSSIPADQRSSREFRYHFLKMNDTLNSSGFIDALCAHEAAHVYYFELVGPIVYQPQKTTLRYDAERKQYHGHFAALMITKYPAFPGGGPDDFTKWFNGMLYANVAGGVVARKLLPSSDGGDQGDKVQFENFCNELRKQYPFLGIDTQACWDRGRAEVERQIDSDPKIIEAIQSKAAELKGPFGFL